MVLDPCHRQCQRQYHEGGADRNQERGDHRSGDIMALPSARLTAYREFSPSSNPEEAPPSRRPRPSSSYAGNIQLLEARYLQLCSSLRALYRSMHDLDDALQSNDDDDEDENIHGRSWDPDLVEAMVENRALFHKQLHELRHQVVGGMRELPGGSSETAEVPGDIAFMDVDAICQPYYNDPHHGTNGNRSSRSTNSSSSTTTTNNNTNAIAHGPHMGGSGAVAEASYYTSAGPPNHGARNGGDDDGATDEVDGDGAPAVRTNPSGSGGSDGYYYGEGNDEDRYAGFYL